MLRFEIGFRFGHVRQACSRAGLAFDSSVLLALLMTAKTLRWLKHGELLRLLPPFGPHGSYLRRLGVFYFCSTR